MSLPLPVGDLWVSTITLSVSKESKDWYGLWAVYDRRPDIQENAAHDPLVSGTTTPFEYEREADHAAKMAGRRAAILMAGK